MDREARQAGYSLWGCKELDTTGHRIKENFKLATKCDFFWISLSTLLLAPDFLLCFRSRLPSLPRRAVTMNITHQSSGSLNLLRPSERRKLPPLISSVTLAFQEMSSLPQLHPQGWQLQVLLIEQFSSEMSLSLFFFLAKPPASGILVLRPGIKPMPLALEVQS